MTGDGGKVMTQPSGRPKSASLVLDSARLFDRLDRLAKAPAAAAPETAPIEQAPILLGRLRECVAERLGAHLELTEPLLAKAQEHILSLFPAAGPCELSEKEQDAVQVRLTALFDELEDILFALSLREQ
jgi:hypothetical protein